jgi:hypothetical protein
MDWFNYLRLYVPLKNFSLIWRRHHWRWRAAKFRPMLGVQGLWAGRDLYRATPAESRDLGISGLIRRTAPFSRLLRHMRGCGGSILTQILAGNKAMDNRVFSTLYIHGNTLQRKFDRHHTNREDKNLYRVHDTKKIKCQSLVLGGKIETDEFHSRRSEMFHNK